MRSELLKIAVDRETNGQAGLGQFVQEPAEVSWRQNLFLTSPDPERAGEKSGRTPGRGGSNLSSLRSANFDSR